MFIQQANTPHPSPPYKFDVLIIGHIRELEAR